MLTIFLGLIVLTAYGQGQVTPRRDEQWPPPDFLEELKPHRATCLAKTGASEDAIKEFSDGKVHDDPVVKCYMNCMFHEYEIVDDAGEFHTDKVRAKIPESLKPVAIPLLETCFNVHVDGETQCDRAHLLHKCWKLADPVHYFLY